MYSRIRLSNFNLHEEFFLSMRTTSPTASLQLEVSPAPTPSSPKLLTLLPSEKPSVEDPDFDEDSATSAPTNEDTTNSQNSTNPGGNDNNSTNPDGDNNNSTNPDGDNNNATNPDTDNNDSTNPDGDNNNSTNLDGDNNNSTNLDGDNNNSTNPDGDGSGGGDSNEIVSCFTSNGAFGSLEGTPSLVTFFYGVETIPNITETILINDILPPLETAFNDILLKTLFPRLCTVQTDETAVQATERSSGRDNRQRKTVVTKGDRRQQGRRDQQLALVGISARPSDYFAADVRCSNNDSATILCFVLEGKISLFFGTDQRKLNQFRSLQNPITSNSTNLTSSEYQIKIRSMLKDAMDSGVFDNGDPDEPDLRLQRVYYIDSSDSDNPISDGNGDSSSARREEGVNSTLVGTFVAIGGALLVVAGVALYRRRQGTEAVAEEAENFDGDSTTMEPNSSRQV
jgi:hypothetical protein